VDRDEGTSLQHAVNTPDPVIQVDPKSYYALKDGVWFTAPSPNGPWTVATTVPAAIYTIPVSSPLHYVTYVQVYGSTPQTVYVGYTPGYYGTVVAPSTVVVYGTGYVYPPVYVGAYWYPPPPTYGYGAGCGWGALTGFAFGAATAAVWGGAWGCCYGDVDIDHNVQHQPERRLQPLGPEPGAVQSGKPRSVRADACRRGAPGRPAASPIGAEPGRRGASGRPGARCGARERRVCGPRRKHLPAAGLASARQRRKGG
jgi:hypothetical protein